MANKRNELDRAFPPKVACRCLRFHNRCFHFASLRALGELFVVGSEICVGAAFAKDNLQLLTPVFAQRDELPIDFGREVTQHGQVGRVDAQRRCGEQKARGERRDFRSGKVSFAFESRERTIAAGDALAICVEGADAYPVVECLQRQMQIFVGFEFDDDEAAIAIEGEQIEHAAIAGRERWNLRVKLIAAKERQKFAEASAKFGFEPAFWLDAEERIFVHAIAMTAGE